MFLQKNKKNFYSTIILVGIFAAIAVPVFAWDIPSKNVGRIIGNIPGEIINTGCLYESGSTTCKNVQAKNGPFITNSFLKAGTVFPWSGNGSIVSENSIFAYRDLFLHKLFAQGTDAKIITGGGRVSYANDTSKVPLISDATNFRNSTTSVEKRFLLLADTQFCNTQTMITTNTPAVQFWDVSTGSNASLRARGVQLSGGNPAPGKVLISTDLYGNAIWATPRLEADGITVTFDYNGSSPVVTGQATCN